MEGEFESGAPGKILFIVFSRAEKKNAVSVAGERGTWPPLVRPPSATRAVRCRTPRCSTRASGAGGGRRADAAKEVRFPSFLRQARRGRVSASAGGFSRIGCSIPRCSRSVSGAGGGRQPDAARGGCFLLPREPGELQQRGASLRSACRPRKRLAKCDAASIRRSIPLVVILVDAGRRGGPGF